MGANHLFHLFQGSQTSGTLVHMIIYFVDFMEALRGAMQKVM